MMWRVCSPPSVPYRLKNPPPIISLVKGWQAPRRETRNELYLLILEKEIEEFNPDISRA
jgi:hypothetical protein